MDEEESTMVERRETPRGELAIRTLAMPADTNPSGDIFGGWVLSQMDIAGSITAARFLQRFIKDVPWAHLDIAGVAWSKKDAPTVPKGGTAFGVRLLERFIAEHYEGK